MAIVNDVASAERLERSFLRSTRRARRVLMSVSLQPSE
jgi:hypothetical protein